MYDDHFTTESCLNLGMVPTNWQELYSHNRELVTDEIFQLSNDWSLDAPAQPEIHWLSGALDGEPIHLASILEQDNTLTPILPEGDVSTSLPQNEGVVRENKGDATKHF